MRQYIVTIGPRTSPRLQFAALAADAMAAVIDHLDLREEGERLVVTPAERMHEVTAKARRSA